MLIDECIEGFRSRSFFMENKLVCNLIVLFIQTSTSGWISLTVDEGTSKFSLESSEPLLLELGGVNDDFAYPIQTIIELNDYIGKKISSIYEYRVEGIDEGCVGIYFDCEDCGFSIIENNGCLSIFNGLFDGFQESVLLYKLDDNTKEWVNLSVCK